MWRGFCCDATCALRNQRQHDQHCGQADLRLDVGEAQNKRASCGEAESLAGDKTAFQCKAQQKRDGDGEHDQVVHVHVGRRDKRAGGKRRGLEIEGRAASPEQD